jgi:hypothetical protein
MGQANVKLILTIPQGALVATSLGVEGFAQHRSPGAGRFFEGRAVYVDVAVRDGRPAFAPLDEGGWRDAAGDTAAAIAACAEPKKRTKTALSNSAFSVTPIQGYTGIYLAKTGGQVLPMEAPVELARFASHEFKPGAESDDIARAAGLAPPAERHPHMYMVLAPLEFVVLSNLTPAEYAWYALHRPGKVFRQVMFTELKPSPRGLVAESVYEDARRELTARPSKKTKTLYAASALNRVGYVAWLGCDGTAAGGVYCGTRDMVQLWAFPPKHPSQWDRADG